MVAAACSSSLVPVSTSPGQLMPARTERQYIALSLGARRSLPVRRLFERDDNASLAGRRLSLRMSGISFRFRSIPTSRQKFRHLPTPRPQDDLADVALVRKCGLIEHARRGTSTRCSASTSARPSIEALHRTAATAPSMGGEQIGRRPARTRRTHLPDLHVFSDWHSYDHCRPRLRRLLRHPAAVFLIQWAMMPRAGGLDAVPAGVAPRS